MLSSQMAATIKGNQMVDQILLDVLLKWQARGTLFVCPQCNEFFDQKVWHCRKCHHHWLTDMTDHCKNCHKQGRIGCRVAVHVPPE